MPERAKSLTTLRTRAGAACALLLLGASAWGCSTSTTRDPGETAPVTLAALASPAARVAAVRVAPVAGVAPVVPLAPEVRDTPDPVVPADWRYPLHPPLTTAAHAMVVSDAALATRVGVDILRAGGNAVDAAIGTAFALAVVYPEAGNLGGGGFMVLRRPDGTIASLDFREMAPGSARRDMYLDAQGNVTRRSLDGWLASGVPGAVMGLWEAHRRFGSMPWARLLQPAIRLAEDGFDVDAHLHGVLTGYRDRLLRDSTAAALLLPGGQVPAVGTRLRNPDLAATLRLIADRGADGFYRGPTAGRIADAMAANGGNITRADLAAYRAHWRAPVEFRYRGYRVVSMPPASSGGLTLALMAGILDGYDLRALGWHSPETLHLTTEAMRRAFAYRNALLGDPDFVRVPALRFLDPDTLARLRAGIDSLQATPSPSIHPETAAPEGTQTTHFGVVDSMGGAVAVTTTLNELFGSGIAIPRAGFFMNDEMDDFTSKPGTPNMFGLVQGEANAIAPGKRPLSAMTPTIVLDRDGRPLLVTGARGGPRIINAVFQVLSNVLDYGMDVGTAVDAPRIHEQHLPDSLYYERGGFPPALLDSLRARGHTPAPTGGVADAPTIVRRSGLWTAGADPRSGGQAAGF